MYQLLRSEYIMRRIKTIFCSLLMLISIMAVPCTTYAYTITASARLYDILGQRRYFFSGGCSRRQVG